MLEKARRWPALARVDQSLLIAAVQNIALLGGAYNRLIGAKSPRQAPKSRRAAVFLALRSDIDRLRVLFGAPWQPAVDTSAAAT